jgi:hypothetical protein
MATLSMTASDAGSVRRSYADTATTSVQMFYECSAWDGKGERGEGGNPLLSYVANSKLVQLPPRGSNTFGMRAGRGAVA